jgi:DNA-directed RNA polymerase specialized sigma24 family protein
MDLDNNRKLIAAALAAVGSGDHSALQTIYRLTATKLFAVCLRILGERSEAEDVLQEVYMTVWRSPPTVAPAHPRNRRTRATGRCRRERQNRHLIPRRTKVEGSGEM